MAQTPIKTEMPKTKFPPVGKPIAMQKTGERKLAKGEVCNETQRPPKR